MYGCESALSVGRDEPFPLETLDGATDGFVGDTESLGQRSHGDADDVFGCVCSGEPDVEEAAQCGRTVEVWPRQDSR